MKNSITDKNNIQKIFRNLFLLCITVFILDFIVGGVLKIFYFKQESGLQYRTTYAMEKTTADVLVFGSSTATHNYYPQLFEHRLGMSYDNAGRDGNSTFYHYAVLEAVLKRYLPKLIIYDFDSHEFSKDKDSYERLSSLLPYYKTHPEIRSVVDLKSPYEKIKLWSKIYPYNSSIFTIAVGNTDFNKKRRRDIDGYLPLSDVWNKPMQDGSSFVNYESDTNKIRYYETFIKACVVAKVKLFIVCSPLFVKPNYTSRSVMLGEQIAAKYNVPFLDYSKDSSMLNNPQLFADIGHLNNDGAKKFSDEVISSIIKLQNSNQKEYSSNNRVKLVD